MNATKYFGSGFLESWFFARRPFSISFCIGLVLCTFTLAQYANAEDMYTWRDTAGHTFFGSHPPRNAVEPRKIGPHIISRYSSEKVVSGFRVKGRKENLQARGSLSHKQAKSTENSNNLPKINGNPAHLSYQPPVISLNDRGEISACNVSVRNEGKSAASDVVVQLTFPDGTFLTSVGPEQLKPGEQATFSLPSNSVPLRINMKSTAPATAEALKPEVMVSYN